MDVSKIDPKLVAAFLEMVQAQQQKQEKPTEPVAALTFADIWKIYSVWGAANIPSWRFAHKSQQKHLLSYWAERPWEKCGYSAADEYVARRKAQFSVHHKTPVKPATINRELATVKAMFNWALRRPELGVKHNPLARYEILSEINDRDFHMTEADLVRLLGHCRPLLRLMLILAFETGMRREEFRSLSWPEVDMDTGVIRLAADRTKGKRRAKVIPLSDIAIRVLRTARIPGVLLVFPSPNDAEKPVGKTTLGRWFQDARTKAGITGPRGQNVWIHTLRKSSITLNAVAGMDLQANMDMHGHTSKKVHDTYRVLTPEYLQNTREALNRRHGPVQVPPPEPPKEEPAKESPFVAFLRPKVG